MKRLRRRGVRIAITLLPVALALAHVLGAWQLPFVEPDASSGLEALRQLARGPLGERAGLAREIEQLAPALDRDAAFAKTLAGRRVALGFYFTQTQLPRTKGALPAPVLPAGSFPE